MCPRLGSEAAGYCPQVECSPTRRPASWIAPLPLSRGDLTGRLFDELRKRPDGLPPSLCRSVAAAGSDELHLALYCTYELHYRGFADVPAGWEWEPDLLRLRRSLEARFESDLRGCVESGPGSPASVASELWALARARGGPSLSEWVRQRASLEQIAELFKLRSPYQLKEADPHTWAIPHLDGRAKAVLSAIQHDEYGSGVAEDMHSSLFARTMEDAGLDSTPNAYLDEVPGWALATTNLISLFGLHRRLRGCLVGHLALFEMTSTVPMSRYSDALARLGRPASARRFFDAHVVADEHHQHLAVDGMVGGLIQAEPHLAGDVLFGARCLAWVEQQFTRAVLAAWSGGGSPLRPLEGDARLASPAA